jgi:hypothetical protein
MIICNFDGCWVSTQGKAEKEGIMVISGWFWQVIIILTILVGIFFTKFLPIFIITLILIAGLFFAEKFMTKKLKGSGSMEWRIGIGTVQCIIAILIFIWAKEHAPSQGIPFILKMKGIWIFDKKIYTLFIIGSGILAIVGIVDIIIGILQYAMGRRAKKLNSEIDQNSQ